MTDDITSLFTNPQLDPNRVQLVQGVIVSWDGVSRHNQVDIGGGIYEDVSIVGAAEAATLAAGQTVMLIRWKSAYYILGRIMDAQ